LRARQVLHGVSMAALVALGLVLVGSYGLDHFRFSPAAVFLFRSLVVVLPLGLLAWLVVRPLVSAVTDARVALYLEEHAPALEASLVSAVEYAGAGRGVAPSPALVDRLVAEALERCAATDVERQVERPALLRSGGILAGTTLVGVALLLLGPGPLRRGAVGLLPWSGVRNPYAIEVSPGDTVVARGSDLKVSATLHHFTADLVEVAVRRGQSEWQRFPMLADSADGRQAIVLFNLTDAADYFVEAGGVRSRVVHIGVADLPHVRRIDLEYHFPAYTGLPPERVEDGGDVAALKGTRVLVQVTPTIQPAGAVLVVDGRDTVPLEAKGPGTLSGQLTVAHTGSYRVVFRTAAAGAVIGSPDYTIDVLSDQPPTVRLRTPGRDLQVTSVEEVFTEAEAHDDYGVARLELRYRVNGGPEQVISLGQAGASKELVGNHTFFLEEQHLTPGDVIAYYAYAAEVPHQGGAQEASSDIYFLQIRPFERDYRAADQQPSSGGGGQMSNPGALSQRQRDIVAGTFNLARDSARYTEAEYRENLATLALAQGKLREDVSTLVGRIRERGIVGMDSLFGTVVEALGAAVKNMQTAEAQLGERKPKEALTPEQQALQQLQRAEAAYKEIQVARGAGGGGAGAQGQQSAEDLADLFDLEMDKLRNQYEQVERGERQQADDQTDEALARLRDLARRQQQENERLRARMDQMASGAGAAGATGSQRQLAQEADSLARRLERLAREQQRPELERTAQSLRDAADAMRRAAAQSGNEGATRGQAALDRLREATERLQQGQGDRLKRDVADALRRTERLAEQQRSVQDEVSGLTGQPGADGERIQRLDQRKQDMAEQVEGLEKDVDRLSRESARDQRDASRKLGEAAQGIRDDKLREKILYSRGVIRGPSPEYARNFEEQIGSDIESLRQKLADAEGAVGESRDQRLGRALERAGDLANGLESMQERLRGQRQGAQPGGDQRGQGGQGPAGQGGQGRPQAGADERAGASRQLDREMRERMNDAERLRQDLRQEGVDVRDLDRIMARMRDLQAPLSQGEPQAIAALDRDVVQGFKAFEFALRRQLAQAGNDRPILTGADEVPEQYRKLVEEYYRRLSKPPR